MAKILISTSAEKRQILKKTYDRTVALVEQGSGGAHGPIDEDANTRSSRTIIRGLLKDSPELSKLHTIMHETGVRLEDFEEQINKLKGLQRAGKIKYETRKQAYIKAAKKELAARYEAAD